MPCLLLQHFCSSLQLVAIARPRPNFILSNAVSIWESSLLAMRMPACGACGLRQPNPNLYHLDVKVQDDLEELRILKGERMKELLDGGPNHVDIVIDNMGTT